MTFKLITLGSGSALPTIDEYPAAHVLNIHEQFYLIDAGEGVQVQLRRYGISPLKIGCVFISHLHGDHVYGLFGLISTMGLLGRKKRLDIYAPAPMGKIMSDHLNYFNDHLPYPVVVHTVGSGKEKPVYSDRVVDVYAIPLSHGIPAFGFLFREKMPKRNVRKDRIAEYGLSLADIIGAKKGKDVVLTDGTVLENEILTYLPYQPRSFAYCSDTLYSSEVIRRVEGVDLLYHEATFLDRDRHIAEKTGHSTAFQAACVALKAKAGRLVIGHFSSRYSGKKRLFLEEALSVFENTALAREGVEFEVPVCRRYK